MLILRVVGRARVVQGESGREDTCSVMGWANIGVLRAAKDTARTAGCQGQAGAERAASLCT
jgi:hypothetical protein